MRPWFPDMCETVLSESIIGRARRAGKLDIHCRNIRDYTLDKHRRVDDTPYGGGKGMLMQAEPIYRCYEAVCEDFGARPHVIFMSPQGKPFTEKRAIELSQMEHILILCGHYEGAGSAGSLMRSSMRRSALATMCSPAASWGPWWWWMQSGVCARASWQTRAVTRTRATTTACWNIPITPVRRYGMDGRCPEVLQNGNHAKIDQWRREKSLENTLRKRPDLLRTAPLTDKDKQVLRKLREEQSQTGDDTEE